MSAEPLFTIVRGRPDDAELAALAAVVVALKTRKPPAGPRPAPWRRGRYHPPGAWPKPS
jgi:hypothetical protein